MSLMNSLEGIDEVVESNASRERVGNGAVVTSILDLVESSLVHTHNPVWVRKVVGMDGVAVNPSSQGTITS